MGQIYKFRPGSHIKADPQVAGEVCAMLDEEGRLTPEELLEESRPKDAPLHDSFEWDDGVAAEMYRVSQAGQIIRCIVVVDESGGSKAEPKQAYVSLHTPGGPKANYTSMEYAIRHKDTRDIVLGNALRELNTFKRKYRRIKELAGVIDAIDQLRIKGVD